MPRELFQVLSEKSANVLVVTVPAGADVSEFDRLNAAALAAVDQRADDAWILDMAQCSYAGSAALGFMINVRQRIKQAGGMLVLCGLSTFVLATLRASSLGKFFVVLENRAACLTAAEQWRKTASKPRKK
jgi:anti-anti-sigma factor